MDLSQRIQAKTDNGDTIIDFLIEVMKGERDDFKICDRLDAARLLRKYGWDEAADFIVDNLPEPSQRSTTSGSSRESLFDTVLAKKIQEPTDDGASVCRFLINVMEGHLKQFKPQHRIAAARELLSRGFGKHARQEVALIQKPPLPAGEGWGEGENQEHQPTPKSQKSPNPTNQSSDRHDEDPAAYKERWANIWEEVTPIIEEGKRVSAEQEPDSDDPPTQRTCPCSTRHGKTPRSGLRSGRTHSTPKSTRRLSRMEQRNSMPRST